MYVYIYIRIGEVHAAIGILGISEPEITAPTVGIVDRAFGMSPYRPTWATNRAYHQAKGQMAQDIAEFLNWGSFRVGVPVIRALAFEKAS